MKRMLQVILSAGALSLFFSCSMFVFNGSLAGLVSDFHNVEQKSDITFARYRSCDDICTSGFPDSAYVVVLNGRQLKECLQNYRESVVYVWRSQCHSMLCYPLNLVQQCCDKKGVELFVVAEYYSADKMSRKYEINHPQTGIDVSYYKSDFTRVYLRRFVRDLVEDPEIYRNKERWNSHFFYFENGQFCRAFNNIEEL